MTFDGICPFCQYDLTGEKPAENELAFVKPDARPIAEGHSLIIPKRHVPDWFDTTEAETAAMNELLRTRREQLLDADPAIEGFNIGMNIGRIAGQTVFHCHIHLVPRRKSDGERIRGSVRGMIRDKLDSEG
jgi:diadenosine tetraphosphate (Ap4A) HIT family hydrolase